MCRGFVAEQSRMQQGSGGIGLAGFSGRKVGFVLRRCCGVQGLRFSGLVLDLALHDAHSHNAQPEERSSGFTQTATLLEPARR